MNPLLKKEIRLILPAWGLAMMLALAPIFLFRHDFLQFENMAPGWFGILILCATSFGREFSLGTFSSLLAQPVPRRQYWVTKVGVLLAALVSVLVIYFLVLVALRVVFAEDNAPTAGMAGLYLLAAIAGGLWLSLLVRQMIAVVWLIFLVPLLLSLPCLFLLSHFDASDETLGMTMKTLLLLYSVAGIAGSWLIFRRAQDAPWAGATIALPDWMSARIGAPASAQRLRQPPLRALIRKEFQLNQAPLLGMGVLFLLHLGVVVLRSWHRHSAEPFWRDMNDALQAFGVLWMIAPLIIGCTSIAEERKLGTLEGQLCQPVSARRQFLVKLGFVTVVGGILSAVLFLAAERFGVALGVANNGLLHLGFGVVAGLTGVAVISFYASSLARNFLQALPAAMGVFIGVVLAFGWFDHISGFQAWSLQNEGPGSRLILWNPHLPVIIATVSLSVVLPWLAYRNFRCLHEVRRIWLRNALGLAAVLVFTVVSSFLLYQRVWENLTPLEPAHGPARLTLANPPVVGGEIQGNVRITLPDGRSWQAFVYGNHPHYQEEDSLPGLVNWLFWPVVVHTEPQELAGAGNWRSLAPTVCFGYRVFGSPKLMTAGNTVGIRPDGTLWVSPTFSPPPDDLGSLVQFGDDTHWRQVIRSSSLDSVLLLKTDGTLWLWKADHTRLPSNEPGLRATQPRQIGADSDWQGLFPLCGVSAQKRDGTVWRLDENDKTGIILTERDSSFDWMAAPPAPVDLQRAAGNANFLLACVRPDGTLWASSLLGEFKGRKNFNQVRQLSSDTNWVAVTTSDNYPADHRLVALKRDGSLWSWSSDEFPEDAFLAVAPVRLGIHEDWVGVSHVPGGNVALAADGSLWLWRDNSLYTREASLLKPSAKPVVLGNIFGIADSR